MQPNSSDVRIRELDGLRAVAVTLVIFSHLSLLCPFMLKHVPYMGTLALAMGRAGVYLFFVISGFIITRLQMREFDEKGRVSLRDFYVRRFFRIIPVYWTYLIVAVLLWWGGFISLRALEIWKAAFFVLDYGQEDTSWCIGHFWTLAVEEQYYLVFPFLIWVLLQGNLRLAAFVLGPLFLVTSMAPSWQRLFGWYEMDFLEFFKCIIGGVLLAIFYREIIPYLQRSINIAGFVAFLFILPPITIAANFLPISFRYGVLALESLGLTLVVGWILANPGPLGFLRWKIVLWIGSLSYSLYVWQQLFVALFYPGDKSVVSKPLLALICIFLVALCSYYGIERPFIALGRRLTPLVPARLPTAISPRDP